MNLNKNYIGAALISLAAFFFWGWILPGYNVISELKTLVRERQDLISSRSAIIANIKNIRPISKNCLRWCQTRKALPRLFQLWKISPQETDCN